MGVGIFAPALDEKGNSVVGIQVLGVFPDGCTLRHFLTPSALILQKAGPCGPAFMMILKYPDRRTLCPISLSGETGSAAKHLDHETGRTGGTDHSQATLGPMACMSRKLEGFSLLTLDRRHGQPWAQRTHRQSRSGLTLPPVTTYIRSPSSRPKRGQQEGGQAQPRYPESGESGTDPQWP